MIKPAHIVFILGIATTGGGFALTFYNHGFVGLIAICAGLLTAVAGCIASET